MDKSAEFKEFLEKELDTLSRNIVFNRNPISIEYHKADFFSNVLNEFVRLQGIAQSVVNPKLATDEFVEMAKIIKRISRKDAIKRKSKVKPGRKKKYKDEDISKVKLAPL